MGHINHLGLQLRKRFMTVVKLFIMNTFENTLNNLPEL